MNLKQHPTVRTFIRSTVCCEQAVYVSASYILEWQKLLSHSEHLCGFSPLWTLMWVFRQSDRLNALSHTWHLYGFSPLWILLWLTRWPDTVNRWLQTVHSNGFSPEWLRLCTARSLLLTKHLPHLYLLAWIFICWRSRNWDEKSFSHWLHIITVFAVCLLVCTFKPPLRVNRLSHTVHKYGLVCRHVDVQRYHCYQLVVTTMDLI